MFKSLAVLALAGIASVRGDAHAATKASWENHAEAFGEMNVDKILLDYTEASTIIVSDVTTGVNNVFTGLAGVRTCFEALFGYLETNGGFPESLVVPDATVEKDQVFLIWKAVASGITQGTDTFITDAAGKFAIQTVTLWTAADKPLLTGESTDLNAAMAADSEEQMHWNNHLEAFATGDIEKMVLDYNADAQIIEWDFAAAKGEEKSVYTGEAGVRELFPKYFGWAGECTTALDVALPVIHVASGFIYLHVEFGCAGIPKWTDTFLIDDAGMIKRQNIIFESGFTKTTGFDCAKYKTECVDTEISAAYENCQASAAANGGMSCRTTHLGYIKDDDAETRGIERNTHCSHAAPVANGPCETENPLLGYYATKASWENHAEAFGEMNVDKILLDYTEASTIIVSDVTTGVNNVFTGLAGVRTCFEALFGYLQTNGGFPASLVVPDATVEKDQVFLIWKAVASGITQGTDTFITDAAGKFAIQTVTLWTAADKPSS